jgi:hypothetical protein
MGKLAHQNVKTVGVLDPGFVVFGAFFIELEHETSNGAISASAKYFFIIPGVRVVFVFKRPQGPYCFSGGV